MRRRSRKKPLLRAFVATLPSDSEAVFPRIRATGENAVGGVDPDSLESAKDAEFVNDLVPSPDEFAPDVVTDRGFQGQVGPGVPKARGFSRLLGIHTKVDQVGQHLSVTLSLHIATHDSEGEIGLIIFQNQSRDEGVEWPFARSDDIGVARFGRKPTATAVETYSRPTGNDPGTKR